MCDWAFSNVQFKNVAAFYFLCIIPTPSTLECRDNPPVYLVLGWEGVRMRKQLIRCWINSDASGKKGVTHTVAECAVECGPAYNRL